MSQFESGNTYTDTEFSFSSKDLEVQTESHISDTSSDELASFDEVVDLDGLYKATSDSPEIEEDDDEYEWYDEYEEDYTVDENGIKWYTGGSGKWVKKKRKKKKKPVKEVEPLVKKELTASQLEMLKYIRENSKLALDDEYVYDISFDEKMSQYTITTPFGKIEMSKQEGTTEPFIWYYIRSLDENARERLDFNFSCFDKLVVNSEGIIFETKDGNWIIDESNKFKYIDKKGKTHLFSSDAFLILKKTCSILFPEGITFDFDGNMRYMDDVFTFNSQGDLVCYRNTKEKVTVYFDYDLEEYEKQELYDLYDDAIKIKKGISKNTPDSYLQDKVIDSSTKVNYIATTYVNGHKYKYYSVGDQIGIDITESKAYTIQSAKDFSKYSEEYLSAIDDYYFGTIFSEWDMSLTDLSETAAAYANQGYDPEKKDIFVFIPMVNCSALFYGSTKQADKVFYHENGHVLEESLRRKGKYPKDQVNDFYNKYKDVVPQLPASTYDTIPNTTEFFGELIANYYSAPEEMQRYIPDAYEFINQLCN